VVAVSATSGLPYPKADVSAGQAKQPACRDVSVGLLVSRVTNSRRKNFPTKSHAKKHISLARRNPLQAELWLHVVTYAKLGEPYEGGDQLLHSHLRCPVSGELGGVGRG
jgi:hypothetical protein